MPAYYNEIEPFAAQWLRNLIAAGHIAPGDVDERSIVDVRPSDLAGYTQCHFFAGIGGWSFALRLAGWPDDRPVWTGSCPCQPFSAAGKGGGFADERHLWPFWLHLIRECRPPIVAGEQVASKDGLGWLDLVQADLEGSGYACGAVDICAAGIGAPHIRQRQWWIAEAVEHATRDGRIERWAEPGRRSAVGGCGDGGLADHNGTGRVSRERDDPPARYWHPASATGDDDRSRQPGPVNGLWRDADWLFCRDGKWRPVEPGTFPLAHGVPGRVGRLRAYGNAIVPEVAAEFIRAYLECPPQPGAAQ